MEPNLQVIRETLKLGEGDVVIPFSAEKGTGRQELVSAILASVEGRKIPGACQGEQNLV